MSLSARLAASVGWVPEASLSARHGPRSAPRCPASPPNRRAALRALRRSHRCRSTGALAVRLVTPISITSADSLAGAPGPKPVCAVALLRRTLRRRGSSVSFRPMPKHRAVVRGLATPTARPRGGSGSVRHGPRSAVHRLVDPRTVGRYPCRSWRRRQRRSAESSVRPGWEPYALTPAAGCARADRAEARSAAGAVLLPFPAAARRRPAAASPVPKHRLGGWRVSARRSLDPGGVSRVACRAEALHASAAVAPGLRGDAAGQSVGLAVARRRRLRWPSGPRRQSHALVAVSAARHAEACFAAAATHQTRK